VGAQVLEDPEDDGPVEVRCIGGDRPKRGSEPDEAAEHRAALRAVGDVLRETCALTRGERAVQRIGHRSLREAVFSVRAIQSGHVRSDPLAPRTIQGSERRRPSRGRRNPDRVG
jgi:hypothetical protein